MSFIVYLKFLDRSIDWTRPDDGNYPKQKLNFYHRHWSYVSSAGTANKDFEKWIQKNDSDIDHKLHTV